jgi:NAD(P)H-hydrate epimerase
LSFVECDSLADWEELAPRRRAYDIIVDALFGTGLSRPLEGVYLQVVEHVALLRSARERNRGDRPFIVSLDVPSGLDADKAELIGETIRADLTVTFTAPKPANVLPPAFHHGGELVVANIGSPTALIDATAAKVLLVEREDAREWLVRTRYAPESYKNSHGHALVIAGSRGFTGAAALCGAAAMRAGAGLVTIATPVSAQPTIASVTMPEIMTAALAETDRGAVSDEAIEHTLKLASKANVIAIGPGLSAEDERTRAYVRSVVERRPTPIVVDADGLNALAPWPRGLQGSTEYPLILTPHPGEMLRLMGATEKSALADRVAAARNFATTHNVIVVLKGMRSLIAAPDGRVFVNPTGNAGLGTAGSGDTLTGLITGFLAQVYGNASDSERVSALEAVIAALYIGGLAGDLAARNIGMRAMVASDIREHFSAAIRQLDPEGETP